MVNSSERRRHLANGIVIAGFFHQIWVFWSRLGFSPRNLGLFSKITVATLNEVRKACRRRRGYDVIFIRSNPNN